MLRKDISTTVNSKFISSSSDDYIAVDKVLTFGESCTDLFCPVTSDCGYSRMDVVTSVVRIPLVVFTT